jgi:hypothetical protein
MTGQARGQTGSITQTVPHDGTRGVTGILMGDWRPSRAAGRTAVTRVTKFAFQAI